MTNHLWQSTLFAIVAGLLTVAFRKNRAQVRYWLWFSASLKFLVPFTFLMSLGSHWQWAPAAKKIATQPVSFTMVQITEPFPDALPFVPSASDTRDWVPIAMLAVWACGFLGIALIRFRGWLRIRAAIRSSEPVGHALACPVDVRSSPGLLEPGVVGLLRPILLLPTGIAGRLTPPQLEAVLAHELCHVRRRDNLFASIHMIVEATFWFHPFVWWIGARLVEERERACDEAVLSLGNEPRVYAEAILNVCKLYVESPLVCVSGVTGANLKKKIEAIMTNRIALRLNFAKKVALAVAGIVALAAPIIVGMIETPAVRAQSARPPASRPGFEVASIKRAPDQGPRTMRPLPNGLTGTVSLRQLMQRAYAAQSFQISGGPQWINSERYAIEAKAAGTVSHDQVSLMLQSLLEERFQLKIHRETRELPVFNLVVAKGGPKLPPPKEGGCDDSIDPQPEPTGGRMAPPGSGPEPLSRCGGLDVMLQTGGARMSGGKVAMPEFVRILSGVLGRAVFDRTRFTGLFDARLDFLPDDSTPTLPPPPPDAVSNAMSPSIFSALPEQLGLRLEAAKGAVEVIVVDHVEKPSEN
jgi:bla regulator protein BlaR1